MESYSLYLSMGKPALWVTNVCSSCLSHITKSIFVDLNVCVSNSLNHFTLDVLWRVKPFKVKACLDLPVFSFLRQSHLSRSERGALIRMSGRHPLSTKRVTTRWFTTAVDRNNSPPLHLLPCFTLLLFNIMLPFCTHPHA